MAIGTTVTPFIAHKAVSTLYTETVPCEPHFYLGQAWVDAGSTQGLHSPWCYPLCSESMWATFLKKTHLSIETIVHHFQVREKQMGQLREQNFFMSIFKAKAAESLHQNKQTNKKQANANNIRFKTKVSISSPGLSSIFSLVFHTSHCKTSLQWA